MPSACRWRCLGNHEFDFGPELAAERIKAARYPWLGTNVLGPDGAPAVGSVDLQLIERRRLQAGLLRRADARHRHAVLARRRDQLRRPAGDRRGRGQEAARDGGRPRGGDDPSLFHGRPQPADRGRRHRSRAGRPRPRSDLVSRGRHADRQGRLGPALSGGGRPAGRPGDREGQAGGRGRRRPGASCPRPGWRRSRGSRPSSPAGPRRSTGSWPCRSALPGSIWTPAGPACAAKRPISAIWSAMRCATPPGPRLR